MYRKRFWCFLEEHLLSEDTIHFLLLLPIILYKEEGKWNTLKFESNQLAYWLPEIKPTSDKLFACPQSYPTKLNWKQRLEQYLCCLNVRCAVSTLVFWIHDNLNFGGQNRHNYAAVPNTRQRIRKLFAVHTKLTPMSPLLLKHLTNSNKLKAVPSLSNLALWAAKHRWNL